ncbi:leucyl aminopeptidase [Demequina sp. TTPB684]|uniref:leucyl aminopeptidase n=1 Tax=unclassified Demequina TaxID=2620311 RepID=UPI001CF5F071|nr:MULTISPECIES: leucyl aminopeptidase [unclassified Demequina]MCB2413814.1 leucyl aminopeptidase [Demequina sp. TTPB684]UPU89127.1 leucyl aminopeptidase [Demequina sp. TMPB413]
MTTISTTNETLSTLACDALILGVDAAGTVLGHPQLPADVQDSLSQTAAMLDATGKRGAVTVLPGTGTAARRVVLVGLGDASDGDLRFAAGAAARSCGKKPGNVVVGIPTNSDRAASAVAEGALLGAYVFTDYKSDADDDDEKSFTSWAIAGASESAIERAKIIAGAVAATRDLINTPPLDLFPASFAEIAQGFGSQLGCDVKVWEPQQLADEGFGGLLAVGMGSSRLPRLVRVAWTPADAAQTIALVGKGITFDTGGISLKPPKSMETMKSDMSGSAAVLHTVLAAARAKLPIAVTGWLCLAENMPSGTAQRPSDIIRIYGGKTVEVLNTDAEGRLVLADGLVRAIEEKPDAVIDVATLTGAQGVALGTRTSGVMGSADLQAEIVAAAEAIDEDMWPMPLRDYLLEMVESKVADLKNVGDPGGAAGMLSAGMFLKQFVGDATWVHLDIARPAFHEGGAYGYTVPGATGAAVRTLFEFLERRSA